MNAIIIETVKEYNRNGARRYEKAIKRWEPVGPTFAGFPRIGAFTFDKGDGFVASKGDAHCWGETPEQAREKLEHYI